MINHEESVSIINRKLTWIKNFYNLEKEYDFNYLSKTLNSNQLVSRFFNKPSLQPSLSDTWQIMDVSGCDELLLSWQDLIMKLGQYNFHQKDRMDFFVSFESNVGVPHVDKEDVFILGLHGKTMYTIFDKELSEIIIEKGDMVFIPSGIMHRSISITPRSIASLSLWSKSNNV
tara:strand:+ start:2062 stop:2580 length:519 start_codon:yes stop_codon:yes gene_type:complete